MINQIKNPTFGGFKPDAMQRIAGTLGYTGDMSGFQQYLEQNPEKRTQMDQFKQAAMMMAKGGAVQNFQMGGAPNPFGVTAPKLTEQGTYFKDGVEYTPQLGTGGAQAIPTAQLNQQQPVTMNPLNPNYKPPTQEQIATAAASNPMAGMNPNQANRFMAQQKSMQLGPNVTTPQITQPTFTTQQTATGGFEVLDQTGKVVKTNLDTAQQAQDYAQQQGVGIFTDDTRGQGIAPQPRPEINPITGMPIGTGPDDGGRVGLPTPVEPLPDLGGYDPSQGMPEPLGEEFITGFTAGQPAWATTGLTQMFESGNLPEDPTDFTTESLGSRKYKITYKDGTTMEVGPIRNFDDEPNFIRTEIANKINEFKNSPEYTQNKAQQDAYRNYLTESTTGGVTGDIENIEQEYTNAQSNYTQQNLELQRLQQQAAANPDDPYLKELVEAKGKEVSDTYGRLQQLQPLYQSTQKTIKDVMTERATDPTLPEGTRVEAQRIQQQPGQFIQSGSGQVSGEFGVDEVALADTYLSANVDQPDTAKYEADIAADKVAAQTQALQSAQTNEDDARAKVTAAMTTASMVGDLSAAQGTATLMENEVQREIQNGELVSGAAADATKAAKFTEQIDAATATPSEKATVQGQLVGLMEQFEGTTPPAWAAGAVRLANQQMAARGLSASSMAGQAIVQAAMESALPIAQADAATIATFEQQNLSNRQQRAMLAAEQRATFLGQEFDQDFQTRVLNASKISDIANMNFTADQQVQLENARSVQTMNLENLSNRQAMVLAEASALANLDMGNLNNRQQTAVQNAQNFLQLDMANLSNEQQTELFKSQQVINSMLTDQAAVNASRQFNAQSENQANQFYDNLNSTINMHNSEQQNAQERFNAGQVNAASQFNAEMKNNREQFNAQNQLVVDQSNATWRREIATQDTAAINRANELNAINTLDISNTAYNNMWGLYGDQMEWAWTSAENQQDRLSELAQEQLSLEERKMQIDADSSKSFGNLVSTLLFTDMSTIGKTLAGSALGIK